MYLKVEWRVFEALHGLFVVLAMVIADDQSLFIGHHDDCWDFERTAPVVVGEALVVGQLVELVCGERRVVVYHVVVRGRGGALVDSLSDHEVVEAVVFDDSAVDDEASFGVVELASVHGEEAVAESLGDDDVGERGRLPVELLLDAFE